MSLIRRLVFGEHPRRTLVRVVVLAAASFITFKWILIPIRTEGSSMLPTYSADRLNLVNRLSYVAATPSRGDVIAIKTGRPARRLRQARHRLAGRAGRGEKGLVLINGAPLQESYVEFRRPWDVAEVTLGAARVFRDGR